MKVKKCPEGAHVIKQIASGSSIHASLPEKEPKITITEYLSFPRARNARHCFLLLLSNLVRLGSAPRRQRQAPHATSLNMKVCFSRNLPCVFSSGCLVVSLSSFFSSTLCLPYPVCSPGSIHSFCFLQKLCKAVYAREVGI